MHRQDTLTDRGMNDRVSSGSDDTNIGGEHADLVRSFFRNSAKAAAEQAHFGAAASAAMDRLAKAVYGHDNGQALRVAAALASIYNGSAAWPVRLDELRSLDWSLQQDLVTVMLGTGHGGFRDTDIREAFRAIGGEGAVEWFHWYVSGERHRKSLLVLVDFLKENQRCSTGESILSCFRSIVHNRKDAALGHLNYEDDELTKAFIIVLDGLWGRDKGMLYIEDITDAFAQAGLSKALSAVPAEAAAM